MFRPSLRRVSICLLIALMLVLSPLPSPAEKTSSGIRGPSLNLDLSSPARAVGSFFSSIPRAVADVAHGVAGWVGGLFTNPSARADDPPAEEPPDPAQELVALRNETTKFFLMPDGSHVAEISAGPVHYQDGNAEWQDIDPNLVPSAQVGYAWENTKAPITVRFAPVARATDMVLMTDGEESSTFGPVDPQPAAGVVSGNAITYPRVYPDVDLRYTIIPGGIREDIILHKDPGVSHFFFNVGGTARATIRGDGGIAYERADGTRLVWDTPPPLMKEAELAPDPACVPPLPCDPSPRRSRPSRAT